MIKNYGEHPFSNSIITDKKKKTSLERYGVENYTQTQEYKEKTIKKNLEKYGTEYYNQTEESKIRHRITNFKRYGVESPLQCKEIMDKLINTNIERYGYKTSLLNNDVKLKVKDTTLKKYGVEHNSQSDLIKEKKRKTYLEHYGVENYSQTDEFKEKCKITSLRNWGVEHPMKSKEISNKVTIKGLITKYKNYSNSASEQQKYLCELLNGELNYPISNCCLDIAFLKEQIYVEYDGSGHRLSVKYKVHTEEEFQHREIRRYYYLKNKGWRSIRIISLKDYLPQDNIIIKMINEAKEYLNTGHSWIEYDIDNNKIKCSQYEKEYDFGELRKIHKKEIV